jgi:hypothetical protein
MNSKKQQPLKSEKTLAEIFKYEVADGVSEYHLMIHAIQPESTYEEQLNAIIDTYYQLREKELQGTVAIFKRATLPIRQIPCWHLLLKARIAHFLS